MENWVAQWNFLLSCFPSLDLTLCLQTVNDQGNPHTCDQRSQRSRFLMPVLLIGCSEVLGRRESCSRPPRSSIGRGLGTRIMAEVKERRKRRENYLIILFAATNFVSLYLQQLCFILFAATFVLFYLQQLCFILFAATLIHFICSNFILFAATKLNFNRWKIVSWQLGDHINGDYVLS